MPNLADKVAVVTGSTKGIGLAIARGLFDEGASVVINGRSPSEVDSVVASLEARRSGAALGFAGDVGDPTFCQTLVDSTVDRFGRLDILVNNAGVGVFKSITEMTVQEWQIQVDTNLGAVFYLSRAAVPHLAGSGDGFIVNIGSLASRHAFAGGTGYNASKFGLLGMTEAMMGDVRSKDIRVSLVMPGSVDTHFSGREPSEERTWRLLPEEVARTVTQLLCFPKEAHVSRVEIRPSVPKPS